MMEQVKPAFLYMYPQEDIFGFEIQRHSWCYDFPELQMEFEARFKDAFDEFEKEILRKEYNREAARLFRRVYSQKLNHSIDARYRQRGFRIFYALLDNTRISNIIQLQPLDRIIYVGMDAKIHRTPDANGKYPYPDRDFILNQLGSVKRLVVSGFHLNDCVKKISRRAYIRGINVLVDEELTELFGWNLKRPEFNPGEYPSINPKDVITNPEIFEFFMQRRKRQPWLYQWQEQ